MWRPFSYVRDEVACLKTSLNFIDSFSETFWPLGQGIPIVFVPGLPLAATALTAICEHSAKLAHALVVSRLTTDPTTRRLYNEFTARQWIAIRPFLAIHYKHKRRLDTDFWRACREDLDLDGAEDRIDCYQASGPSRVWGAQDLGLDDPCSLKGYLVMFVGMQVPSKVCYTPTKVEVDRWAVHLARLRRIARRGIGMQEALRAIRSSDWEWDLELYLRAGRW